jgi:hypothetical protein
MGILDFFKSRGLIHDLKEELAQARVELDKRQEAINKTNAYWKRVVSELKRKK